MNTTRCGFKWTVNEILSLQREFELLGWTIDQIATKHKRTPNAIMYKLDQEGFADYNVLYSNYHSLNTEVPIKRKPSLSLNYDYDTEIDDSDVDDDKNDEDYVDSPEDEDEDDEEDDEEDDDGQEMDNISQRLCNIETSVYEIKLMLDQLMSKQSNNSKQCFL